MCVCVCNICVCFKGVLSNPVLYCVVVQLEVKQLFYCDHESHTKGGNKSKYEAQTDRSDHQTGKGQRKQLQCRCVVRLFSLEKKGI